MKYQLLSMSNSKVNKKAQELGYFPAVLHLAPAKASGYQVCAMAKMAGCIEVCLNTAGRGGIAKDRAVHSPHGVEVPDNAIQAARIRRTRLLFEEVAVFWKSLISDITQLEYEARTLGLKACVRLNGTSDLRWESMAFEGRTILERFPKLQFYDYTKLLNRRSIPANYDLTISYSTAKPYDKNCIAAARSQGRRIAAVWRGTQPDFLHGFPTVSGDDHDLRFLDPLDSCCALTAKGRARKQDSALIVDC